MDKDFWKSSSLSKKYLCPYCSKGILEPIIDSFRSYQTKKSIELEKESRGQYPCTDYHIAGSLICNKCSEIITTCGTWTLDRQCEDVIEDKKTGELKLTEPEKYFKPKYFFPNLRLFELHKNIPTKVKDCIDQSFALYWSDIPAGIHKIRVAIEYLMDEHGISRIGINCVGRKLKKPKHRREKKLSLHERLELFKKKNTEIGDYLLNLKDLGNQSAHTNSQNNVDTILQAYEILEYVLKNLYGKPAKIEIEE